MQNKPTCFALLLLIMALGVQVSGQNAPDSSNTKPFWTLGLKAGIASSGRPFTGNGWNYLPFSLEAANSGVDWVSFGLNFGPALASPTSLYQRRNDLTASEVLGGYTVSLFGRAYPGWLPTAKDRGINGFYGEMGFAYNQLFLYGFRHGCHFNPPIETRYDWNELYFTGGVGYQALLAGHFLIDGQVNFMSGMGFTNCDVRGYFLRPEYVLRLGWAFQTGK